MIESSIIAATRYGCPSWCTAQDSHKLDQSPDDHLHSWPVAGPFKMELNYSDGLGIRGSIDSHDALTPDELRRLATAALDAADLIEATAMIEGPPMKMGFTPANFLAARDRVQAGLLTVTEVAERFGIAEETIWAAVEREQLGAVTLTFINGDELVLVPTDDGAVKRWLAENQYR